MSSEELIQGSKARTEELMVEMDQHLAASDVWSAAMMAFLEMPAEQQHQWIRSYRHTVGK